MNRNGMHWYYARDTHPELYRLARDQAYEYDPHIEDVQDLPKEIQVVFGSRLAELTLNSIDREALSLFGWGYCGLLALALHDETQAPIAVFTVNDTDGWEGHAAIALPNGKYLDIAGVRTASEIQETYAGAKTPVIMDRGEFVKLMFKGEHKENPYGFLDELEKLLTFHFANFVVEQYKPEFA